MNKFFHVELYYETGQYNMETGEYGIQRSELHQGYTTVSSLPMGPMTYYIHLKDHSDLVVGRTYTWKVRHTRLNASGERVPDLDLPVFSQGQTMAVAP